MKEKISYFLKESTMLTKLFIVVGIVLVAWGGKVGYEKWWPKPTVKSEVIAVNDLPPLAYDKNANAPSRPLPDTNAISEVAAPFQLRGEIMGWNAQSGLAYANGGPFTMVGSIMEEQGVRLNLICQNNCGKQGEDVFVFAQDYAKGNKASSKGCHMIAWMGDGVPSYLQDLNERIKKQIGEDYILQVFATFGASFGEDKAIFENGSFKQDPQKLCGSLWCGVIRDGDWNILMKYADMNQIPVNTDLTTYDPTAINWMQAPDFDYTKAAVQYVSKTKEKREIVINGKRTGRDTTVAVNGCVTWFPGDQVAFQGRGGVTVASTKEFGAQMANTWLAPKKWLQDNRDYIKKFIYAGLLGGDQVKSHASALTFACQVENKIYQDKTMSPKDWENAFKGIQYTDPNGNVCEIGGSRVFNLADAAEYYGLTNGGTDKYQAVYTTFGDLCVKAYPKDVPKYPAYEEVVDLSYMSEVYAKNKAANTSVASMPTFKEGQQMTSSFASKKVSIEFDLGSANIKPASYALLQSISNDLVVAENLLVSIEGHTDNTGNPGANITLSQQRADAVKNWLIAKNPKLFKNKITSVGYGQDRPVDPNADNNSKQARDKNRRVEIKLGE
jgi:outer membrane protein OmpA-like peptidoglycan-associated protein